MFNLPVHKKSLCQKDGYFLDTAIIAYTFASTAIVILITNVSLTHITH